MYKIKVGEKEYDVQPQPHDHTAGTLNGKEYKIDYSKIGTGMFIKIHQDSIF